MKLDQIDHLPTELLDVDLRDIQQVFPNPTLITVAGAREEPLFVSTLLHGNETTSFDVLKALTARYNASPPPRSLMIFVGNVEAATQGARFLPGQPDFNRIWAGGGTEAGPAADLAHEVMEIARHAEIFASIDIHNNTGANPLYGCINSLRPADLQMAELFSSVGVYYDNPSTTQSIAFSRLCPAVTIECGQNDDAEGLARATNLVEQVLRLEKFTQHMPSDEALKLYHTVGRVVIDPKVEFSFGDPNAELVLHEEIEGLNFTELAAGEVWADACSVAKPFSVLDEHGSDLTDRFFAFDGERILLKQAVTPSMITRNKTVIRQDCLCYLMVPRLF